MSRPPGRHSTWTSIRGFREAILDPGVRLLIGLTAFVILGGAPFYMTVEGWGFVDSLYFATVTISTVGYGDLSPETAFGRLFTIGYIVVGIGLFVALASAIADHLIRRARRDLGVLESCQDPDP